nr:rho-N domain-containing protein 1, chloroplastic [Ipomoea batatas]
MAALRGRASSRAPTSASSAKSTPSSPPSASRPRAASPSSGTHTTSSSSAAAPMSSATSFSPEASSCLPTPTPPSSPTSNMERSGEFGIVVPGCAETYQYSQQSQQSEQERHQKIGSYRQGDILVFTEGTAHWVYNSGEEQTVMVVLQDTSNDANQLDANPLRFFLAGNSEQSQGNSHQGQREQGRHQQGQREQGRQQGQEQQHGGQQEQTRRLKEQLGYNSNLLSGFDVQIIKDALNTDMETAQKIVGENSQQERGHIITVEKELQLIAPWYSQSEERESGRHGGSSNGLEETLCTARVRQNIDNPERADIYDPQAGRFTALNRFTLPIFGLVRLSASRGVLNRNWGIVPKWTMNAHSFVYVTKGSAQVQIVNHQGETILDQQVQEGQLFLVPQNFAVVKQAGDQGFEWVEFNTNENAMYNTLSGRTSTLAGLPADIIAASYDLSSSKAQSLKQNMVSTWFYQASKGSRFVVDSQDTVDCGERNNVYGDSDEEKNKIYFPAKSFTGFGLPDGKCLPCSGLSGGVVNISPCSSPGNWKKFPKANILHLESTTRSSSFVCSASSSNPRNNPDFSKYSKHGGFRRQNEDRDGYDNLEESEMFSSENGPLLTASNTSKVQGTATPGPREKKIVELFRKVQAQLRERAAVKEGNKVPEPKAKGKGKESETVDSLLKLLRKHAVQKEKKTDSSTDFILDQSDERSTDSIESKSILKRQQPESEAPVGNRPMSNFRRRSPVSRVKFQPSYSEEDTVSPVAPSETDGEPLGINSKLKSLNNTGSKVDALESLTEPIFSDVFDELSEDESTDIHDEDDNDEEHNQVGANKFDEMTVPELRAIAKTRGVKGYSKMKKVELIELLSQT